MCPPDHKHESTCFVWHKCRCGACRAWMSAAERRRNRLKAYGRWDTGLVDAQPVREHVEALQEFGIGYMRVARLAGVQPRAVAALIYGRQESGPRKGEVLKRIKRETADKILSVEPSLENVADRGQVPSYPYVRMVRALVAWGWSQSKIANALGFEITNFRMLRDYDRDPKATIRASTARRIAALYEEWSATPPPHGTHRERISVSRSRRYGRERGWALPLDWEAGDFYSPRSVRRSAA